MALSDAGGWPSRDHPHHANEPGPARPGFGDAHPPAADLAGPRPDATIVIVRPRDHQDVYAIGYEIGVHFLRDVPVIINLEDLSAENATRVVDFVSGTIFGRRGDIERLSTRLFLIVPSGSTVIRP